MALLPLRWGALKSQDVFTWVARFSWEPACIRPFCPSSLICSFFLLSWAAVLYMFLSPPFNHRSFSILFEGGQERVLYHLAAVDGANDDEEGAADDNKA